MKIICSLYNFLLFFFVVIFFIIINVKILNVFVSMCLRAFFFFIVAFIYHLAKFLAQIIPGFDTCFFFIFGFRGIVGWVEFKIY
jgi:hypothetical protein